MAVNPLGIHFQPQPASGHPRIPAGPAWASWGARWFGPAPPSVPCSTATERAPRCCRGSPSLAGARLILFTTPTGMSSAVSGVHAAGFGRRCRSAQHTGRGAGCGHPLRRCIADTICPIRRKKSLWLPASRPDTIKTGCKGGVLPSHLGVPHLAACCSGRVWILIRCCCTLFSKQSHMKPSYRKHSIWHERLIRIVFLDVLHAPLFSWVPPEPATTL
jgi:hypothetical protein